MKKIFLLKALIAIAFAILIFYKSGLLLLTGIYLFGETIFSLLEYSLVKRRLMKKSFIRKKTFFILFPFTTVLLRIVLVMGIIYSSFVLRSVDISFVYDGMLYSIMYIIVFTFVDLELYQTHYKEFERVISRGEIENFLRIEITKRSKNLFSGFDEQIHHIAFAEGYVKDNPHLFKDYAYTIALNREQCRHSSPAVEINCEEAEIQSFMEGLKEKIIDQYYVLVERESLEHYRRNLQKGAL